MLCSNVLILSGYECVRSDSSRCAQPSLSSSLRTTGDTQVCVNPEVKMMVTTLLQKSTTASGGGAALRCDSA